MGQALTEREIESIVREVTDEEVAFLPRIRVGHDEATRGPGVRNGTPARWSGVVENAIAPPDGLSAWRGGKRPSRSARSCSVSACQRTQRDS